VVNQEEWVKARKALLEEEKDLTRHMDEVVQKRLDMPWVEITKDYVFQGSTGAVRLIDLFTDDHQELFVYHLMFDPADEDCCPTCSWFVDGFDGYYPHLVQRANLVAVGKAPYDKISALAKRQHWQIPVLSSFDSDFNEDMAVERNAKEKADKSALLRYNFHNPVDYPINQYPGLSVFAKKDGKVFLTYGAFARGLDFVHTGDAILDMLPFGREGFAPKHKSKYRAPTAFPGKAECAPTDSCVKSSEDSSCCEDSEAGGKKKKQKQV